MPRTTDSPDAAAQPPTSPTWRYTVMPADREAVRQIVTATGFFRGDEIDVAVELVDEYLLKGEGSGYHFVLAEVARQVVGYACYGPIACTIGSYDLYWIAVAPGWQGRGLGQALLAETERQIWQRAGRCIYIETSGRPQYAPTRGFYQRCGYRLAAVLPDFYDLHDDKVIWEKRSDAGKKGAEHLLPECQPGRRDD